VDDRIDETLTVRNFISLVAEAIGCVRSYETDARSHMKRSRNLGLNQDKAKTAPKVFLDYQSFALFGTIN
jgi:hypothetical protein